VLGSNAAAPPAANSTASTRMCIMAVACVGQELASDARQARRGLGCLGQATSKPW